MPQMSKYRVWRKFNHHDNSGFWSGDYDLTGDTPEEAMRQVPGDKARLYEARPWPGDGTGPVEPPASQAATIERITKLYRGSRFGRAVGPVTFRINQYETDCKVIVGGGHDTERSGRTLGEALLALESFLLSDMAEEAAELGRQQAALQKAMK